MFRWLCGAVTVQMELVLLVLHICTRRVTGGCCRSWGLFLWGRVGTCGCLKEVLDGGGQMSRNSGQLCCREWMGPKGVLKLSCLPPSCKKCLPGHIRCNREWGVIGSEIWIARQHEVKLVFKGPVWFMHFYGEILGFHTLTCAEREWLPPN